MTKPFYHFWQFWIVTAGLIACLLYIFVRPKEKPTSHATATPSKPIYRYLHDTLAVADTAAINRLQAAADKWHNIAIAAIRSRDFNLKQLHEVDNLFTDIRNNAVTDSIAIKTIVDYLHGFIYNAEQRSGN